MISIKIKLSGEENNPYVEIPPDVMLQLDKTKKRIKVNVTFNGIPYRGSITVYGGIPMIGIRKDIQQQLNKKPGATITFTIEKDEVERTVKIPVELKQLFAKNKKAELFFNSLSYSNKKEYAVWIASAKREETKNARITSTIDKLNNKKKNPSEK